MSPELRTLFEGIRQQAYEACLGHGETMEHRLKEKLLAIVNDLGVILDAA